MLRTDHGSRTRRLSVWAAAFSALAVLVSGCTASAGSAEVVQTVTVGSTAAAGAAVTVASTAADGATVTVESLPPSDQSSPGSTGSSGSADPSSSVGSSPAPATTTAAPSTTVEPPPVPEVVAVPKIGSVGLSPSDPISITVQNGTLTALTLTNPEGRVLKGALSTDKTTWTLGEVLGYNRKYTVTGTATGTDGKAVPIEGSYTTVEPKTTIRTTISPGDGKTVGVAAPVIIGFGVEPEDRLAMEKRISITTTPEVQGAWAWINHDGGQWGLDYRPKGYWPEGTKVTVTAQVYGFKFATGSYGAEDLSSTFTIGRNRITYADVNSHDLIVKEDGKVVATYPASFGRGTDTNTTTRSGIHVVNEKFDKKLMSNPKYGYTNVLERYAVRISNNGEFIHANPKTVSSQGNTNVSHGCVNLSLNNAKAYYDAALYGDPVEVTGTKVQLNETDGDVFDWAIDWDVWVSLSGNNS